MNEVYFYFKKDDLYFSLRPDGEKTCIRFITTGGDVFETIDDKQRVISLLKESYRVTDEGELAKLYLIDSQEVLNDGNVLT